MHRAAGQEARQEPAAGQAGQSVLPKSPTQAEGIPDLLLLPLGNGDADAVLLLDPVVNDATAATRGVGDAGAEDEHAGSGAPRGASSVSSGDGASYAGLSPMLNESTLDGLSQQQSFRAGTRGGNGRMPGGGTGRHSEYSLGAEPGGALSVRTGRNELRGFSALYAGAGVGVHAETRAGTGQLHGSVQWLTQESALAATNPYSVATTYSDGVVKSLAVKPSGVMNQVGVSLGLPLQWSGMPARWRKKLTLAGSLEAQLHEDKLVSSPASAGFFSLTANQLALLGNRGVSGAATNTALDYLSGLTGTTSRSAYRMAGLLRLDGALSARDHVALTYQGDAVDAPAGAALGQASDAVVARGRGSLGDSHVDVQAGSIRWTRVLSRRWNNEVRAQQTHDLEYESPRAPLAQEPAIGPGGFAPQVSIGPDGFAYGTPSNLGRTAYPDEQRVEIGDTLRVQLAHHAMAIGGSWSRVHDRIANLSAADGAFLYDSSSATTTAGVPSAGGLVDWITDYTFNVNAYPNGGCPQIPTQPPPANPPPHYFCFRTYTQGFDEGATEFVTHEFAGFVQDAWQARKDLTLTVGVRYDYTLLPLPQAPNQVLDADLAAAGIVAATSRFPEDRNNVGPRVTMAWSPSWSHGVTVQAGYGVFYGRVPGATVRAALTDTEQPTSSLHVRITPQTETQCPQVTTISQGFGYACAYTSVPPAAVAQTTSTTVFAPNFRAPLVQRTSLTLEREFGKRLTVRAGYAMVAAKQLPASTDLNIAPATGYAEFVLQGGDAYHGLHTGETFAVPLYQQRRVLQYGPVTEIESNANAYYSAGTLEAQWRGRGGLAARGSYTFSRAIDDGAQQSATPSEDSQFDPFANGYDKGLSGQNFPQRFAGTLQYELHTKSGPKVLQRATNGLRFGAIATAGSGAPYSYAVFGGTRLSGGRQTINGSGGATYLPTVGRNTLRLPPRGSLNLRAGREFAAGPTLRMSAFAEAFNLLNERNLAGVDTRAFVYGSSTTSAGPVPTAVQTLVFQDAAAIATEGLNTLPFGTATSSTTGASRERRIQFGLRVQF